MKRIASCFLCACALLIACAGSSRAVQYVCRDLGFGDASEARGINDNGQVVGYRHLSRGKRAFVWKDNVTQDLGAPWYDDTTANDINNNGQVVGIDNSPFNGQHASLWTDGNLYTYPSTVDGLTSNEAFAINDSGQVVGRAWNADTSHIAFMWQQSTGLKSLGTLGGLISVATDINNTGQVVGEAYVDSTFYQAFIWYNGSMVGLGTLANDDVSYARAINDSGQVVGTSGNGHAVTWTNGVIQRLYSFGGPTSNACDINNKGMIVGVASTPNYQQRPCLWVNGVPQDLGTLPGYSFGMASAINENGQIAGYVHNNGGMHRAVIWEPVPEPSSISVLLIGLGSLFTLRRRR